MLEDLRKALKKNEEKEKYSAELRKFVEENPTLKTPE
jgi:hypothetical protein